MVNYELTLIGILAISVLRHVGLIYSVLASRGLSVSTIYEMLPPSRVEQDGVRQSTIEARFVPLKTHA